VREETNLEQQFREASDAVQHAEQQLRVLLSQLGEKSEEVEKLLDAVKRSPSDFKEDAGPAKKAFAEALLQRITVESRISDQQHAEKEAKARSARAIARSSEEAALFAKYAQLPNEQLQLNVGGQLFTTSKSSLLAADEGSLFEVLYSGRHGTPPSPLFIDRNPNLFVHVLDFLRISSSLGGPEEVTADSWEACTVPKEILSGVAREARFFGLKKMRRALAKQILFPATMNVNPAQALQDVAGIMVQHADDNIVQEHGREHLRSITQSVFRDGEDFYNRSHQLKSRHSSEPSRLWLEQGEALPAVFHAVRKALCHGTDATAVPIQQNLQDLMGEGWWKQTSYVSSSWGNCCKFMSAHQ